jgi:hypothetical protein
MKCNKTYWEIGTMKEGILAYLVRKVDIQPSQPYLNSHIRKFKLLLQQQKCCKGFPYYILSKNKKGTQKNIR